MSVPTPPVPLTEVVEQFRLRAGWTEYTALALVLGYLSRDDPKIAAVRAGLEAELEALARDEETYDPEEDGPGAGEDADPWYDLGDPVGSATALTAMIAAARGGSEHALDLLEDVIVGLDHEPTCPRKAVPAAECLCIRSTILDVLVAQGRDV